MRIEAVVFLGMLLLAPSLRGQAAPPPATTAVAGEEPVEHGHQNMTPPKVIHAPQAYTADVAANLFYEPGHVLVYLHVGSDGMPSQVRILHGLNPHMDAMALEAVMKYRFRPAVKEGKPVRVEMNVDVFFPK